MKDEFSENSSGIPLQKIDNEAAEWIAKNDRGLSSEEQDAFVEWLSASEQNRKVYAEHNWSFDELDRLIGLPTTENGFVDPDVVEKLDTRSLLVPKWQRFWIAGGIAASVLVILSVVGINSQLDHVTTDVPVKQVYVERIQKLELEDGSVVDLNRGAVVRSEYSEDERVVVLLEGEANFDVAKDPNRPFIVEVSGIRLRAVGTVFNVKFLESKLDVLVTEGVVALAKKNGELFLDKGKFEPMLSRHDRAVVDFSDEAIKLDVTQLDASEVDQALLWQPKLIDFEDSPLSVIVTEFNKRNSVQIVVADQEIEDLRLSSIFWSDNVNGFVHLLESTFGVKVECGDDSQIILRKQLG